MDKKKQGKKIMRKIDLRQSFFPPNETVIRFKVVWLVEKRHFFDIKASCMTF